MTIERLAGPRILRGTADVLQVTLYVDGVASDASVAPTVTITRGDGSAVASGAATTKPAGTTGVYQYALTAAQTAEVDELTAVWSASVGGAAQTVTTYASIIGDHLFTLAEARAFDGAAMQSVSAYPNAAVLAARDRIQDAFEDICDIAFGTRYARELFDGRGSALLQLRHREATAVRSIETRASGTTTWTAYTPAELADVLLYRDRLERETLGDFGEGRRTVRVTYEHGVQPIPLEVKRAGLQLLRHQLVASALPRNAISQVDELGTFRLATPGQRGSYFGLPEVDEVLARYRIERLPRVL